MGLAILAVIWLITFISTYSSSLKPGGCRTALAGGGIHRRPIRADLRADGHHLRGRAAGTGLHRVEVSRARVRADRCAIRTATLHWKSYGPR